MKLLQLLLNALFFLGLYAWKSTNIIHPLNKFRTLRSFAINNDNSETDVSPKSALAKRILIKKKIVTNASSQTKPSNIFGRKETNKKPVFDLLDESTIKFAKEGKYQDSNFVNLDRLIKDDKKTVDNKFSSQGNQQRGKIQGDYEVQQYLEEISEEFEDLTTPENIQYFQPETESNLPLSPLPNVEPQLNAKPVDSSSNPFKSGFVSIIGNPNVGKSTLMNFLLKQKLSIVSAKPQTTRHKIYGILTEENQYQIVFMDTPGMLYQNKAAYTLHETMQSVIRYAAMDTDVLLLITDIFSDELQDEKIMEKLKRAPYPVIIVVNKIDLLPEISLKLRRQPKQLKKLFSFNETLPKLIHPDIPLTRAKINETVTLDSVKEKWKALLPQAEIIPVSAAYNLGVTELLEKIVSYLKPGPKYYPSDYVSDRDERFFTSEIIRESIFESFDGEIPYCCEVYIEDFQDVRDDFSKITATIYVNRKSQVNIVVGREGCKIKEVGMKSRQKLENFLERKVHLDLQVKNDPDWRSKKDSLKKFGYIEDE